MKPKHFSIITIVMVLVLMGLSCWYAIHRHGTKRVNSGFEPIKPLSEIRVPDATVLKQMDLLERNMHRLSSPPRQFRQNADLSALGYVPVSPSGANGADGFAGGTAWPGYRVTLAFEGQGRRFCIIDSELYPEGAALPDGATIVKIESRRVLITKESRQQWLVVDSLIDTALSDKS